MQKKYMIMFLLFSLLLFSCSSNKTDNTGKTNNDKSVEENTLSEHSNNVKSAHQAPNFTLTGVDNTNVSLSDYYGKVVVLNFWATWCPPCRAEIPDFIDLYSKYKDKGLVIIGVSLDNDRSQVKPFINSNNVNFPVLYGDSAVSELYGGIRSIPTTFLINRQGEIVDMHIGQIQRIEFEAEINKLL